MIFPARVALFLANLGRDLFSVDGSPVELVTWQVTAWTDRTEVCKLDTFYELFCFASRAEVF